LGFLSLDRVESEMFESLGLNELTESVYLLLFEFPGASIGEIAQRLGHTESQIAWAIEELLEISLLHRPATGQQSPQVVDPEFALTALAARCHATLARRQQEIEEDRVALLRRLASSRPRSAEAELGYLEGAEAIRRRTAELAASAKWEICVFTPGGGRSAISPYTDHAWDTEIVHRGVRLRRLCLDSVRNDRPALEHLHRLDRLGGEVRTVPALPLHLLLVDRRQALTSVDPAETTDSADSVDSVDEEKATAVTTSNDALVAGLLALFDSVWRTAVPLRSTRHRDSAGLSAQERYVLKSLAEGLTDEATARRLGVSVRTTRREASDLFARLGARSRFQAGARAFARGWIDEDDIA
jgi:DNA-binding CsgD family transcriptional regulator